ncbi:AraC family transcriptional regulator [Salinivibrio sp. VYel8]|nr:AraC family transcriptional regulator [Salinivibrio sp. VYel1]MPX95753.1 AraC family transcriptional regulator [Salinivibrio sp. VYel6]MPY02513.1 AraC family transcriptional regulator [Salinivibrio sp. VYel5]MPY05606.1 AraC family transcriptional regulator [Salinivibrio sp. VYel8]MPY13691.1 AraC family transcriptional regulator [Salinivibrio sp. VGrn1]
MKRRCLCLLWLALIFPCLPLQAHDPLLTSFQSYGGLNGLGDVRDVAVQSSGGMWLLDNQGRIHFFDGHQRHPLNDALTLPDEKILTIAYAHQALWMAGRQHVYRFQPSTNTLTAFPLPDAVAQTRADHAPRPSQSPRLATINNTLWHIQSGQISVYQREDKAFHVWRTGPWRADSVWFTAGHRLFAVGTSLYQLSDAGVRQLTRFSTPITAITAKQDRAWISTEKRVYLLALSGDQVKAQHVLNTRGGYQRMTVGSGGLWAANHNGLFRLSLDGVATPVWQPGSQGIAGQSITFLWADFEGGIWFSTDQATRYRAPGQRWITHQHRAFPSVLTHGFMAQSNPWGLERGSWRDLSGYRTVPWTSDAPSGEYLSATRDAQRLWWSTPSGTKGINTQTGVSIVIPDRLVTLPAEHLYTDAEGTVWLSVDDQVMRYWPDTQTLVSYGTRWQTHHAGEVLGFYDDGRGSVWIRDQNGLTRYRDGHFKPVPLAKDRLPVQDMYTDERGRLWLTSARGVYQYDPSAPDAASLVYLSLPDERFHCVTGNRDGVWAYSNQALVHIAPRGFVRTFRLPSDAEKVACYATQPHQLTLLAGDYTYQIDTDQLAFSLRKPPSVVIGAVWQQRKRWRIGPRQQTAVTLLEQSPAYLAWGSWPPERQVTRVHYQLVPYQHAGQPMADKLAAWQQTGSDTISLANMVGGHYQLRIAIPRDGASHTVLDISVSLPLLPHIINGMVLACFVSLVLAAVILALRQRHLSAVHIETSSVPISGPLDEISDVTYPIGFESPSSLALASDQANQRWTAEFEKVIAAKYRDPDFSMAQVASALAMSERNLQRKCRQYFGVTVTAYVTQKRLSDAAARLQHGYSVADVAEACGYRDPAYFSQRFKSYFGVSPSQYRRTTTDITVADIRD